METTAGKNISSSAGNSSSVIDKTVEGVHEAVDKLAGAALPVIDRLTASAHQTVDQIANSALPAVDWIENNAHQIHESTTKLFEDINQSVRDKPLIALGAALAVGLLIGQITKNRE